MPKLELRSNGKEDYAIIGDKKTILTLWVMLKGIIIDTKEGKKE